MSRRKIVQDPYNLPKKNKAPGQVAEFADRTVEDILDRQKVLGGQNIPKQQTKLRNIMIKQ